MIRPFSIAAGLLLLIAGGCASEPRSGSQHLWQQGDAFENPGVVRDIKGVQKMQAREQDYFH